MGYKINCLYSVIVPIYQDFNILGTFLDSLKSTILPKTEVILINDGNSLEIKELIEKWSKLIAKDIKLDVIHHNTPEGSVISINEGLLKTTGEYIFILDSDIILLEDWQDNFLKTFEEDSSIGIVGGVLLYPQTGGVQHSGITFTNDSGRHLFLNGQINKLPKTTFMVQSVVFAMCCIKRDVFIKGGNLDEGYYNGYEDYDFNLRAQSNGFKVVVNPKIIAYHWEKSNGKHRAFNRKKNLGKFWRTWGNEVHFDLWLFLELQLQKLQKQNNTKFIGIDLCEVRIEASNMWDRIKNLEILKINDILDFSHRVNSDSNIWLPQVLSKDLHRYNTRFIFLVDNFVKLQGNYYWYDIRKNIRKDDLVVDMHANVYDFSELEGTFWPGNKVR